jgi:hypothetical protein
MKMNKKTSFLLQKIFTNILLTSFVNSLTKPPRHSKVLEYLKKHKTIIIKTTSILLTGGICLACIFHKQCFLRVFHTNKKSPATVIEKQAETKHNNDIAEKYEKQKRELQEEMASQKRNIAEQYNKEKEILEKQTSKDLQAIEHDLCKIKETYNQERKKIIKETLDQLDELKK